MELETLFRDLVEVLRAKDPSRLHQPHRLRDIQYGLIPYRSVRDDLGLTCSEDHEMLLLRLCSGEGDFFEISDPDAFQALQVEADGVNPDLSLLQVYGEVNVLLAGAAVERILSGPDAARAAEFAPPREDEEEDPGESATSDGEQDGPPSPTDIDLPVPPPAHEPTILPPSPMAPEPKSEPEPLSRDAEPQSESVEEQEAAPEVVPVPTSRPTPPPFDMLPSEAVVAQCDFCGGSLPGDRQVNFCPHCGQNLASIRCKNCSADLEWGWRHCVSCGEAVPDA